MNPQSLNRYAYVLNNPVNFTDPQGLQHHPLPPPAEPACSAFGLYCWGDPDPNLVGLGVFAGGGGRGGAVSCTLDGLPIPCSDVQHLARAGAAVGCPNNDCRGVSAQFGPGGTTVVTRTTTVTVRVPGGCVSIGPNPPPCNAASSYETFTISMRETVNDLLLPPQAVYVLGTAGRIAAPVADPRFIAGWYVASAGAAYVAVPGVITEVNVLAFESAVGAEVAVPGIIGFTGNLITGLAPSPPAPNWGSIAAWSYQLAKWLRNR